MLPGEPGSVTSVQATVTHSLNWLYLEIPGDIGFGKRGGRVLCVHTPPTHSLYAHLLTVSLLL